MKVYSQENEYNLFTFQQIQTYFLFKLNTFQSVLCVAKPNLLILTLFFGFTHIFRFSTMQLVRSLSGYLLFWSGPIFSCLSTNVYVSDVRSNLSIINRVGTPTMTWYKIACGQLWSATMSLKWNQNPVHLLHKYYDNTNRLRRAFLGNTNPEVNNSARACEGAVLTEGLVFPGNAG